MPLINKWAAPGDYDAYQTPDWLDNVAAKGLEGSIQMLMESIERVREALPFSTAHEIMHMKSAAYLVGSRITWLVADGTALPLMRLRILHAELHQLCDAMLAGAKLGSHVKKVDHRVLRLHPFGDAIGRVMELNGYIGDQLP